MTMTLNVERSKANTFHETAAFRAIAMLAGCTLWLSAALSGCGGTSPDSSPNRSMQQSSGTNANFAVVRVYYATDRTRVSVTGQLLDYGAERSAGGKLALGTCDVSIPRDHRMGRMELPSIWRFEFHSDPAKHIVLQSVVERDHASYYDQLRSRIEASKQDEALVFIHGYNVPFRSAALRTGQLAYDLGLAGAAVMYSWPSEGKLLKYTVDGNNAEWTAPHLAYFLRDLAIEGGAKTIHVIAHSMGNRALLHAVDQLAFDKSVQAPLIRNLVLMAPDVDAEIFMQLAERLLRIAQTVTLYASSNDGALKASKRVNGYRRAGDVTDGIVIVAGMDSVDVSAIDTSLMGHSYYGDRRSVLSDVFYLLRGMAPSERSGIQTVIATPFNYYRMVP